MIKVLKPYCAIFILWAASCSTLFAHHLNGVTDSLRRLVSASLKDPARSRDTATVRLINELAYEFYELSPDSTLYYGELEIAVAKKINDKRGIADGCVQVASALAFKGEYDRSAVNYKKALGIYKRINYSHGLFNCYTGLGDIEGYLGDYDEAIRIYRQALQISLKANNEADVAECFNLVGIAYDSKGDYSMALDNYFKSLAINLKQKDYLSAADKYCNIGVIMHELELNAKALDYYKKAHDLWFKLGDQQGLAAIMQNIGEVLLDQGKYAEALANFRYAEAIYKEIHDRDGLSLLYDDIGLYKLKTNQKDSAIYYFERSLQFAEQSNIKYNKATACVGLAHAYNSTRQFKLAYMHAQRAKEMADKSGSLAVKAEAMQQVSAALAGMRRFEEAYAEHLAYTTLRGKLKHNESVQKIALYNIETEFAKRQQDRINKQKERELAFKRKLAAQRNMNLVYAGVTLVFAILAATYYWGRRRQKAINAVLNQKNNEIVSQQEDINRQTLKLNELNTLKDRLIGVLAHDLRAPISTLRGLFGLMTDESITHQEFVEMAPTVFNKLEHTSDFLDTLLFWINSQVDAVGSNVKTFNIDDVLSKELVHIEDKIRQKDINITVHIAPDTKATADPSSIRIVVHNILTNAIKFSNRGGLVEISATTKNDSMLLCIKDNGIGMSTRQTESLFKSRVDSLPGTENESGTGMGLLFCKDLVEKYNGKIWVESTGGQGSKFCFELPAAN